MRITRREFMKYCAAAAGALGLTTTDLVKLEKAMASNSTQGGTQVVWLNGASCTGCTVSLANTAYFASIQDLLVPWASVAAGAIAAEIGTSAGVVVPLVDSGVLTDTGADGDLDLVFIETLNSAVGFNALNAAKTVLTGSAPFVLAIEGAIQTKSSGNYCRIGNGTTATDTATISFMDEVIEYATNSNCLAVLAVGTCASFGGIPAANGSVTAAKGLVSTGSIRGGGYATVNNTGLWDYMKATNDGTYGVSKVTVTTAGSGYTVAPTVAFTGGTAITAATAVASLTSVGGGVAYIAVTSPGDYSVAPTGVTISGGGGTLAAATVTTTANKMLTADEWTALLGKTVCVSGCPPHPDWIVGTIVYILTYGTPPLTDKYHRPFDFYGQYQCTNCLWKTNKPSDLTSDNDITLLPKASKGGATLGNSPKLYKNKYSSIHEGCLGVMGCKGRKTKADCSYRRWNGDAKGQAGIGWCVQTRAGCHGCTDPRFPDGWGKFFSFK